MKTQLFPIVLTAVHLHMAASAPATEPFVAHEWGTFTSVQGADGVQMAWNPLNVAELPRFVHGGLGDSHRPDLGLRAALVGKGLFTALQRMETPVIYFYSEREQTVDVSVRFPQGRMTEWYPSLTPAAGSTPADAAAGLKSLHWPEVRIFPKDRHPELAATLPFEPSGSHYYAARETDAAFLQVRPSQAKDSGTTQTERFLFYRGVGDFRAPLTVTQQADDGGALLLQNSGSEELRHLFVYEVRDGAGRFIFVPELAPGSSRVIQLAKAGAASPLLDVRRELAAQMRRSLAGEGLFPAEAAAMVKTWDDSWFAEPGVRVLYTLPRAWTDRTLPLSLSPTPGEIVRVMVGRAELITPAMEWALMKQLVRYADAPVEGRGLAVAGTQRLGLGRFLEPAMRRVTTPLRSQELQRVAHELMEAARSSGDQGKARSLAGN